MPARLLECVGPAMVEHIFALAVGLEISGHRGGDRSVLALDQDRRGRPAGAVADASRLLQRRQERVTEEGIAVAGKRVPGLGVERRNARRDACDHLLLTVGHRPPR
jgi:hypothetical protein